MHFFKKTADLQAYLSYQKSQFRTIGFAPTMGALHQGHMSLIEHTNKHSDISVSSIFVNPTQFNDPEDLEKYPRTLEEDINLLYDHQLNTLFVPSVEEVYPVEGIHTPDFNFGKLDQLLEGAFRKDHFAGVAQVVHRLLEIVRPDHLYMGQKDYQQWTIIYHMLQQIESKVKLVMVPTVREKDGLAMSSRNRRLTPEWRSKAPLISSLLTETQQNYTSKPITEICEHAILQLEHKGFRPEYFNIVDGYNLENITNSDDHAKVVACTAAWAGDIRLIDNMILKDSKK